MDRVKRDAKKGPLEDRGPPKQAASPAQEATRARIKSLEAQLRRLKNSGILDQKTDFQVRCLEEDLRKAHSKLRRLLNEAERQRRRRERLRGGGGGVNGVGELSCIPYEPSPPEEAAMAALKSCSRFQDLARELNVLGFTLTQNDDFTDDCEVDGVKVEVELIEGDGEVETDIKEENNSTSSCSEIPSLIAGDMDFEDSDLRNHSESYRRWFERQAQAQQQWEEKFMREQMELARSILESVTSTFLQGIQQVISNLTVGRRFPPYCPDMPPPS